MDITKGINCVPVDVKQIGLSCYPVRFLKNPGDMGSPHVLETIFWPRVAHGLLSAVSYRLGNVAAARPTTFASANRDSLRFLVSCRRRVVLAAIVTIFLE
jgi:hypothetical protein